MLEKQTYQDTNSDGDFSQFLTPSYFYEIVKRRIFYFLVPFLLIAVVGSLIAAMWPARYLSKGTILVEAQAIPSDMVRPTVAALANDRIQMIEQRILTRDNLLTIAKKFQLSKGWQERMSGTEIVDFIKARIVIEPAELKLKASDMAKSQPSQKKDAVAFTVGFEYERPQTAALVANELVTMILNEDVRLRTSDATETTRFIDQEVKRLEAQLGLIDNQIAELKRRTGVSVAADGQSRSSASTDLDKLRQELLFKSATESESHPDIKALKAKIAALEKITGVAQGAATPAGAAQGAGAATPVGFDTLITQRKSTEDELNKATQKLSAARLGESLERGQHSERLEVIEQPTPTDKPVSPNRPKLFTLVFALALMAGGGLAGAAEMLNQSIRRSSDLFSLVDSHLVVTVPYIATDREVRGKKRSKIITIVLSIVVVLGGIAALLYVLPPLDLLFDKIMKTLVR